MHLLHTPDDFIAYRKSLSGTIGLVPTMGALHAGHLSLVNHARADNQHVITTIFVNPAQFGQGEDFTAYPRTLDADLQKLAHAGVDAVFLPTPDNMYPRGYQTYITVEDITRGLEGAMRPTHFRGVTTVVAKLFNLAQPTTAYFGQKDAQQVCVIRRMVRDLHMPLSIAVIPTSRESDGLAMSSRNVYLSDEQRTGAVCLSRGILRASSLYDAGERNPSALLNAVADEIQKESQASADYIALNVARTLAPIAVIPSADWGMGDMPHTDEPLLLSLTVRFGKTRLLDNALLPHHLNTRDGLTAVLGAG
ncbi:MAG: pantoate--beta-alanine ligase [Anaerolineae bacterium]|nr:pantoate--beta-alanine ligase [Anaerolineae bacterium]